MRKQEIKSHQFKVGLLYLANDLHFFLDNQRSLELAIKIMLCFIPIMYAFASLSQTALLGWLKTSH